MDISKPPVKGKGGGTEKSGEDAKREFFEQKYTFDGRLAEAVLLAGRPFFLVSNRDGTIDVKGELELESTIVRPPESTMYLNKPYSFSSKSELDETIDAARKATIDSLFDKTAKVWQRYTDAENLHTVVCAADTVYTYFQDKLGLTHYLFFVGNNGSGKSNRLRVLQQLAYRNMTSTDVTSANIYRFLGTEEEGQGTICEDEADAIDEQPEKMRIYKNGYTTGFRVMRLESTNYGMKQYAYCTFGLKAFAAERLPDSVRAKGFNQRCVVIPCYHGFPQYDITEVINPSGVAEYQAHLDELNELRNTLLIFRLLHHHEAVPQVRLNIEGREKQLFSPVIRVFNGTESLPKILDAVSKYVGQQREANANGWHAFLYKTVKNLIARENRTEIEFSAIWEAITNNLPGDFKNEKRLSYESEEFGTISKKGVSETLTQIFGARQSLNRREARKLVFDNEKLQRLGRIYELEVEVQVVADVTEVTGPLGEGLNQPGSEGHARDETEMQLESQELASGAMASADLSQASQLSSGVQVREDL